MPRSTLPLRLAIVLGTCASLCGRLLAAGTESHTATLVADTYIQRGTATTSYATSPTLNLRRDSNTGSSTGDRYAYLRFSVSGVPASTIVDTATLRLTLLAGAGSGATAFTYDVYGLPDGHPDEAFDPAALLFSTASNASSSTAGSFALGTAWSLGSFTTTASAQPQTVTVRTRGLEDFIGSNRNAHVTLVIVRRTASSSTITTIASSEDADANRRPALSFESAGDITPATSATSSSTLDGTNTHRAANASDGDPNTAWTSAVDGSSTQAWLRLDLGMARTVNRFSFIPAEHGRTYRLESSLDGTTWTTLATGFRSGIAAGVNTTKSPATRVFAPRSVRYLRLTSLSSSSGKSLSVWEAQAFLQDRVAAAATRLGPLQTQVAALVSTTQGEQLREALADITLERAEAALHALEVTYAGQMMDDLVSALAVSPASLSTPVAGLPNIGVLAPLHPNARTTTTNPYVRRMVNGADLAMAAADGRVWEKNTPEWNDLSDFSFARTTGWEIESYFWLYAHPDSPRRHNPEVLRRLLRRTFAYLDAIDVHGTTQPTGQLASFYDDFAIGPASGVFRELQVLYPAVVLPNLGAQWDRAMSIAGNAIYDEYKDRVASWVNTDLALSCELFNFGTKLGRADMLAKATYFIDSVFTFNRMFDDGAVCYIYAQNEAGGYQYTVAEYLARYVRMTGYEPARELLRRMEWYGPVNGPFIAWWTSPSWKHMWNTSAGSDHAGEYPAGTNPYARAELDAAINAAATATNWTGRVSVDASGYTPGITALPRPDGTLYDRNILGPRAWYGAWNYAATVRPLTLTEPGHFTLMGAQVMDTSPSLRLNASVMGVYPRLRVSATPGPDTDGTFAEARHAWLTSGLEGDSTVNRDFSALAASYKVHTFGSSTKGTEHDWTARQVWLNLPDRIVGLLDIAPNADLSTFEVQGAIRLGYGGTAIGSTKTIAQVPGTTDTWTYGNLRVRLHSHSFAAVTVDQYAFRVAAAPITEITVRDRADGATATTANLHTAGTRRAFLTEVRPTTAVGDITATELPSVNGLMLLDIDHPTTGRRYRVAYNPGTAAVSYAPALTWTGTVRLHRSGQRFRQGWLPAPSGPLPQEFWTTQTSVTIGPKAHVVFERVQSLTRTNSSAELGASAGWQGSPTLVDGAIATWDNAATAPAAVTIGDGLALSGLRVANPGGSVTINSGTGGLLALGSAGIDASTATQALTLNAPLRLDANQTWTTGNSGISGSVGITAAGPLSGPSVLTLAASSNRAVQLDGASSATGGIVVNSGTLLFGGTLAGPIAVNGGTVELRGATSSTALTLGAAGRLRVRVDPTLAGGGDSLAVSGGAVLGGTLEIQAAAGLPIGTLRTLVSVPGTALAGGAFANLPEGGSLQASGYHWSITRTGGDGNDVVLTLIAKDNALAAWRINAFGRPDNGGSAADEADPDGDSLPNLLEFALGLPPLSASQPSMSLTRNGPLAEFSYLRSINARTAGATTSVEWTDSLSSGSWNRTGITEQILPQGGDTELVLASLTPTSPTLFVRLSATAQ